MTKDQLEPICMEMIAYAGEGKGKIFDALTAYQKKDEKSCRTLLHEAETYLNKAHEIQFMKLMGPQSEGEEIPFNLLLIHGMDLISAGAAELEILKRIALGE